MSKGARREITRDDDGNLGERGGHPAADAMDWDEALRVIAHLKADGDWRGAMLIACGCYLGLRISDMLRLRWQDVTQEKDIRMREQKTGKLRMMRVNAALARTASECYVMMRSAGGKARAEDYVLPGRQYGPSTSMTRQRASQLLKGIKEKYRISTASVFSTHTMRKTFGRHVYLTMLERGEKAEKTLEYLRDVFGHASVSITRRYIGIRRDEILSIYDNL